MADSDGAMVTNKEIFTELRQVHGKLDIICVRVNSIIGNCKNERCRIDALEKKNVEIESKLLLIVTGVSILASGLTMIVPVVLNKLFGG